MTQPTAKEGGRLRSALSGAAVSTGMNGSSGKAFVLPRVGLMIFIGAAAILVHAVRRFLHPVPLESVERTAAACAEVEHAVQKEPPGRRVV